MKGKEHDSRRNGIKKEDRARQGKELEHIYIYTKEERKGTRGGQVGELGRVEPLRWHVPGDERGDCQGGRENNSGRRVKMKTVSGVPFPESVFFNCWWFFNKSQNFTQKVLGFGNAKR